jgi:Spy/CpxP family protein refolding chaperone
MFIALLLMALFAFDAAYAEKSRGYDRRGERPEGYGLYRGYSMNFELEPKQAAKMQAIRNTFFTETIDLRTNIFKHEQELDAVMVAPDLDLKKATKIQDTISDLRAQLARKRLKANIAAREVLTPEQIAQLSPGCLMGVSPRGEDAGVRGRGGFGQW